MIKAIAAGAILAIGLMASGPAAQAQFLQPRTLDEMCAPGSPPPAQRSLDCLGAGYRLTLERDGAAGLVR
jgi:hypothetical protein